MEATMTISRRTFVAGLAAAPMTHALPLSARATGGLPQTLPPDRFDPWLEIDRAALAHNVRVVARLGGGRPVLAVVKNNAYGLGLAEVASLLEPMPEIGGFAVVKTEAALMLREVGVRKPVLLMGLFGDTDGVELVRRDVRLSLCVEDSGERAVRAAARAGRPARAQLYIDTGMSRMGVPYHRALPWLRSTASMDVEIEGTFTAFAEEADFDREQLRRFRELVAAARGEGIGLGTLHAASSNGVFHLPDAHLDQVRPGIALYGAYPSFPERERAIAELRPAVRLRARVVRVERLREGDSVSYGRGYVAQRPTWVATIPAGHTDGVPREAVRGAQVVIGGRLYPAIGAVSASHTIVEVGPDRAVEIGDVATLLGSDDPAVHPNAVAAATGRSVYDVLMHLDRSLPKVVV
jgi:alanine racemase